jgi:hypothetical protein
MIDKKLHKNKNSADTVIVGGKFYFLVVDIKEELLKNGCFSAALRILTFKAD